MGFTMDITSVIEVVKLAKESATFLEALKQAKQVSPDLSVSVWFAGDDDKKVGAFQGITVTLGGRVGLTASGIYSKETTFQ
jgi:hypothetical protein